MPTATKQKAKSIPQRGDIEEKYKWNLSDLYRGEDAWESDFKKSRGLIEKAAGFSGRLGESPEVLYECLETQFELFMICHNLYQYARLSQDVDNRVSRFQAMTDRAAMLNSEAEAAFSFVQPELLTIDDKRLREMADKFPKRDVYDLFIEEVIRHRPHTRSAEVEEVLAQARMIARGPDTIFTMLDDADLKYPTVTDENGEEVRLTKQRFAKYMESSDRRLRREASDGIQKTYKEHINTIGASLSTSVNTDLFYARARHYDSCLHMALDEFNIPMAVYHSLLDTTEANLEGLHKWIGLRKKILELDEFYPYDAYCPLFPAQNYDIDYHDAIAKLLEAVRPLGDKYGEVFKGAFEKRWIDVYETEGKGSGAYSWGNYSTHPWILMNYNNTITNMFTLVHEMGHAMHSYLSNATQPYPKAQYSIFVAEVASTLNEGLLLQHLLGETTDEKQKLFLLNRHIDKTFGTFFHQVLYARFELMIHEVVERGEALSPDTMCQIWEDLTKKYYGPELAMDEYTRYKWARIPHFYRTFYVYQYATSYAASQAILEKFLAGEKGIIDRYLELLSSGGSDYPINQLRRCGVDMNTPAPVEATIRLFAEQVDRVAELTGN